jgi:hypothetical protein
LSEFRVQYGQLAAHWVFVGNKGAKNFPVTAESEQFWLSTMVDMDSRLRVACGIAKNDH